MTKTSRYLMPSVLLTLLAVPVLGQSPFAVGARAGFSQAYMRASFNGVGVNTDGTGSFFGGIVAAARVAPIVTIQIEGLYVPKGFDAANDTIEVGLALTYIEVPVLGVLNLPLGEGGTALRFSLGPSFGFEVGCKFRVGDGSYSGAGEDCPDGTTKSPDVGIAVGFGLLFKFVTLDVIATDGLTDINDADPALTFKNRTVRFSAGVLVPLGR